MKTLLKIVVLFLCLGWLSVSVAMVLAQSQVVIQDARMESAQATQMPQADREQMES